MKISTNLRQYIAECGEGRRGEPFQLPNCTPFQEIGPANRRNS